MVLPRFLDSLSFLKETILMNDRKKPGKNKPFFSPDDMVTSINQAICRDLEPLIHESSGPDDPKYQYAVRQIEGTLKKYITSDASRSDDLEELAFLEFEKVNESLAEYRNFTFPDFDGRDQYSRFSPVEDVLIKARCLMRAVLTPFTEDEWHMCCKNSSGVSQGVSFADTSMEAKFTFPITVTERSKPLFLDALGSDPELRMAIESFNRNHPVGDALEIVRGSRATTVEKKNDERRVITIEPTGNMYLQQGQMEMMYARMRSFFLDVALLPDEHKVRAFIASITGRDATIDWKHASNCVLIELCRWLTPPKWFRAWDAIRSPYTTIRGREIRLNMFSTMGNAVTFPLETLVFWTIAHGCRQHRLNRGTAYPEMGELKVCSVFGDDCILPVEDVPLFREVLTSVGFIMNDEKSFYGSESFRESCGGDYYSGRNVRPYSIRAPSSTKPSALAPWLYTILNSLVVKYISCFGELTWVYDKEVFKCLARLFQDNNLKLRLVPDYFPEDSGFRMSHDIERFSRCYKFAFERIAVSEHGTASFTYHRFQFRNERARDDHMRYANWLKKPVQTLVKVKLDKNRKGKTSEVFVFTDAAHRLKIRRIGGYVVARGLSSHWDVPDLNYRSARRR
jgi:hypothetical protein